MKIEHLHEHKTAIPLLAAWIQTEWGHLLPNATFETFVAEFAERTACHSIPETFVALEDGQIVGTASIVASDMVTRPDLSPWLAAVYVLPQYRNVGIGSALVRTAIREKPSLGIDKLYLFTPDREGFYSRLGWRILESRKYRRQTVTIMVHETAV